MANWLRAITAAFFQESYVVYANNPVNILRNRKEKLFKQEHILEIYYISSYLISMFDYFNKNHLFSKNESLIKYYLIMIVNALMFKNSNITDFTSRKMEAECKKIIESMKNNEYMKKLFSRAKNIISEVVKENNYKNIYNLRRSRDFNQLVMDKIKKYY